MARVAIISVGLLGHVGPAIRLGARLRRRGFAVHAWAPDAHEAAIEAAGAVFHSHEPVPVHRIAGGATGFAAELATATEEHAEALIEELLRLEVDVVVHDCQALWGRVAADFLGLPRVISFPLFPPAALVNVGQPLRESPRPLVQSHPPGWELSLERFAEARAQILHRWGMQIGEWPEALDSLGPLTVNYTTPEIVGRASMPDGWRFVGPLLEPRPGDSNLRMRASHERGRPLVYVSLGTYFNFVLDVYRMVIDALADARLDLLISTGGGLVSPDQLAPLPANVRAVEFAAGRETLAESDVMVSHCGINSVHEALVAGVPVVCLPQAHDQFAWAARLEQLGAGRIPADDTPDALASAVLEMLDDPRPRARASELGRDIERYDGDAVAAAAIEEALSGVKPA